MAEEKDKLNKEEWIQSAEYPAELNVSHELNSYSSKKKKTFREQRVFLVTDCYLNWFGL